MTRFIVFAFVAWCTITGTALAEHEADHRYSVRGYVLDEQQSAISDRTVTAYDGDRQLATTTTDSSGYYSLHLHLHNEDRGRKLRLRAGPAEVEIRVSFDPDDSTSPRIHDANFVGGKLVEGDLGRLRIPPWIYPLAGLVIIGFALVVLEKRRKKKRRLKQSVQGGKSASASHGRKKKKHRKR